MLWVATARYQSSSCFSNRSAIAIYSFCVGVFICFIQQNYIKPKFRSISKYANEDYQLCPKRKYPKSHHHPQLSSLLTQAPYSIFPLKSHSQNQIGQTFQSFQRNPKLYNKSIVQYFMLDEINQTQQTVIDVIGWVYFFAWSLSFYGQIYTNFKVKNVQGMNFDFVAMNLTGFLFYSIYNTYGYFIDDTQTGKVDLNDIFFAYHALFATLLTITQIFIYPKKNNRVHSYTVILLVLMWTFAGVYSTLILGTKTITVEASLGEISFLGYFKLAISSLKYLPQLYWNYQRKSTAGWSIFNILMDLAGGLFSFGQMGLEAIFGMDVKINIVKLVLGIMVVFYDILFIVQHYCLYPERKRKQASQYAQFVDESIKQQTHPKINKSSIQNSSQEVV